MNGKEVINMELILAQGAEHTKPQNLRKIVDTIVLENYNINNDAVEMLSGAKTK